MLCRVKARIGACSLGYLNQLVIGRAACRGFLLDFGVFPDLEGTFPDQEKYFQNLKIAVMALDHQ